jgi:hypothetical protein
MSTHRVGGTAKVEKQIIMYKFNADDTASTYSSNEKYKNKIITHKEFSEINGKVLSTDFLMVKQDKKSTLSLRREYKLFIKRADFLKKLTKGKINLYKTGSESNTAMQLFYDLCLPKTPDPITEEETEFLRNCRGQLKCAIKYKGKGWKLDIVSEYPSIMRSDHMSFPIKAGKLVTMTKKEFDESNFFKYGVYRVRIISRVNPFIFRFNEKNYYTHIDLNFAKTLKYDMEIIEDDKPNFLSYEGCLTNGAKLFRPFVDYLFKLKNLGFKSIKIYLNKLWGKLIQRDLFKINTASVDNQIWDDKEIVEIGVIGDDINHSGNLEIDVVKKGKYYKTDFGRISPFMLAKGRFTTAQYILKNIDDVVYINTDGYILKKEPHKDIKNRLG